MVHKFYSYLLKNQVILALFLIILGWFIFQTRGILVSVFLSYIIMAALMPAVQFLKKRGLPNIIAVLLPALGTLIVMTLIIFPLIPFFLGQITSLAGNLPEYLDEAATSFGIQIDAQAIQEVVTREVNSISRNAVVVTTKVFGGVFSALTVVIVSFYLLLYYDHFKRSIAKLFHRDERTFVENVIEKINDKLGAWLRGQLLLSLFIGLITYISLSIMGLPYALPLALIAGLLEVIPTLGPTLAAIPAVIVALTINPPTAVAVVVIYIIIQIIENNFLVPKIMQRAVGLNPVIVILGVMIGANLMGIAGALLSIPFISFIIVLFQSINNDRD
jgi:predicted PurR-regulated permease PerM